MSRELCRRWEILVLKRDIGETVLFVISLFTRRWQAAKISGDSIAMRGGMSHNMSSSMADDARGARRAPFMGPCIYSTALYESTVFNRR